MQGKIVFKSIVVDLTEFYGKIDELFEHGVDIEDGTKLDHKGTKAALKSWNAKITKLRDETDIFLGMKKRSTKKK